MDYKTAIKEYIDKCEKKVVELDLENSRIKYDDRIVKHQDIRIIRGEKVNEEYIRAYLVSKLVNELDYPPEKIELETTYSIGRPSTSAGRIDIIVKDNDNKNYFFIECKAPEKFESDKEFIKGQLFDLARADENPTKYLVYYTVNVLDGGVIDNSVIIDFEKYTNYDSWISDEYPSISDEIPAHYQKAKKTPIVKGSNRDLSPDLTFEKLDGIRKNLHNVLWGGGGTDDNEVFAALVNIILAKIQDESEKSDGEAYDFQVFGYEGEELENVNDLYKRLNELYKRALTEKINMPQDYAETINIINREKVSPNKLMFAVQTFEKYSFKNAMSSLGEKDVLGKFFEDILREGTKQSKGQFFTHSNIVRFIVYALALDELAINKLNNNMELPYVIDPSTGSGTFLIEAMKVITKELKYNQKSKINNSDRVKNKFEEYFMPDYRENKWAKDYLYGIETNFNLGLAAKVNMLMHGDESPKIFVKDGLLPFNEYDGSEPNLLNKYSKNDLYDNREVNEKFDVVISNPPFSVTLGQDAKKSLENEFLFSSKKNSENLFIERWYQLLNENGRLGVVLPENVFDTTENKYIRLFIYKYFKVKAVVSLPQVTFEPYTSTKTSLLFAQKKTKEELKQWNEIWDKYANEWGRLKTRIEKEIAHFINGEEIKNSWAIYRESEEQRKNNVLRLLKNYVVTEDHNLSLKDLVLKYTEELSDLCKFDKDTKEYFGHVNTWWVFGEVAKELSYSIFMAEIENVGYKRTKRGENEMPNELYQSIDGNVVLNDGKLETALDYMRNKVHWD
ncbi:restriction endonuclease subunit M [Methanococcus maripaludis]|uniref:Type I restriction enzyme M protein n=1 Tax=Methanococcus maripaludis TaxID=39152 RepID=A0A7J9SCI7_METMI|nr:N-6 DNA methylase [Methanococcus maripaludis]MBB6497793.1 type I restriction enzyme M protein [Methanococcus maripaludis]